MRSAGKDYFAEDGGVLVALQKHSFGRWRGYFWLRLERFSKVLSYEDPPQAERTRPGLLKRDRSPSSTRAANSSCVLQW